jgi:hypothetical protein
MAIHATILSYILKLYLITRKKLWLKPKHLTYRIRIYLPEPKVSNFVVLEVCRLPSVVRNLSSNGREEFGEREPEHRLLWSVKTRNP